MTQHNITDNQSNWSNGTSEWDSYSSYRKKHALAWSVFVWTLSVVEVPIMLSTLYAMCFLVKSHRAASVFVVQLILSDLIQVIIGLISAWGELAGLWLAYFHSLIVGVCFMACVSFERYLLVSHPIWHKTHQTRKSFCLISVIIWFVPLIFGVLAIFHRSYIPLVVAGFAPYTIIILCFVGTWRGLSHSISLTSQKRKMILGSLFLVLLSYTFIILPFTIMILLENCGMWGQSVFKVLDFAWCLLFLNPLADCLLYLFMRTDVADIMPSLRCCCRSDTHQISVRYTTRTMQSSS